MPRKASGKRTKSKAAAPAKRQKKTAKTQDPSSSSESEEDTAASSVPVAASSSTATAKAKPTAKTTPQKKDTKSLSDDAKDIFRDLAAKVVKGEKLTPSLFNDLSVNDLKNALKLNDRSTTGNRGDLVKSAVDCITNGCPPRCPHCGGGRLRYQKNMFTCPGYRDDEDFVNCHKKFKEEEIDRVAWKSP